jgi:hypothetical protein
MKCFTHRDTDAVALCQNCGKGLCGACAVASGDGMSCAGACAEKVCLAASVVRQQARGYAAMHKALSVIMACVLLMGFIGLFGGATAALLGANRDQYFVPSAIFAGAMFLLALTIFVCSRLFAKQ